MLFDRARAREAIILRDWPSVALRNKIICHAHKHAMENSNAPHCRRWNARGETITDVQRDAALRLFHVAEWETNCSVVSWNGSRPRLRVINSPRHAPLITAARWSRSWRRGPPVATMPHPCLPRGPPPPTDERETDWNENTQLELSVPGTRQRKGFLFLSPRCLDWDSQEAKKTHKSRRISISIGSNYFSLYASTPSAHAKRARAPDFKPLSV